MCVICRQGDGRTEGVKRADDAALGTEVVLIEAMLFESVHGCGSLALPARERVVGKRDELDGI